MADGGVAVVVVVHVPNVNVRPGHFAVIVQRLVAVCHQRTFEALVVVVVVVEVEAGGNGLPGEVARQRAFADEIEIPTQFLLLDQLIHLTVQTTKILLTNRLVVVVVVAKVETAFGR